jgi:hypothetical protein
VTCRGSAPDEVPVVGMRIVMMKIRYPRFTAIELWVLVISVIIAAGIQI